MTTPEFPNLAELQTLVWRLLAAPEGVAKGAAALRRSGELAGDDLEFLVAADARLGSTQRLDIYADMYFYRLRDCLAEDYSKLAAWIEAANWHNLVTDYLLAHPSTHFSLRELGRALPAFLETHPLPERFPLSPDLAQLEWARVDVFDARDVALLSREALLASAADPSAGFRLIPAARLLRLDASVLPLWKRLTAGERPDAKTRTGRPGAALVWRRNFAVFHRSLEPDEEHCLSALLEQRHTLGELGERLLGFCDTEQAAAERLAALLAAWTRDAVLTSGRD